MNAGCQNAATSSSSKDSADIEISESVLRTAKWMKFDYKGVLEKAKVDDPKALQDFIEFHGAVDGIDAINHGVTCLELIPVCGDGYFANACLVAKPKLRTVLLERLTLAQGRTKKEALRKPMHEWAPATWAVLNNLPVPPTEDQSRGKNRELNGEEGGKETAPANSLNNGGGEKQEGKN